MPIILVPFCAEDFQEITDNQHVINQDGSGGSSLKQAQNKDEEAKPCFSSLKQAQNKDEEAKPCFSSLKQAQNKDEEAKPCFSSLKQAQNKDEEAQNRSLVLKIDLKQKRAEPGLRLSEKNA